MIHEVKCKEEYFALTIEGKKPFELRRNDRNYQVGDYLAMNEIDYEGKYTGRFTISKITCVIAVPQYVREGYCALGLANCNLVSARDCAVFGGEDKTDECQTKNLNLCVPIGYASTCNNGTYEARLLGVFSEEKLAAECGDELVASGDIDYYEIEHPLLDEFGWK